MMRLGFTERVELVRHLLGVDWLVAGPFLVWITIAVIIWRVEVAQALQEHYPPGWRTILWLIVALSFTAVTVAIFFFGFGLVGEGRRPYYRFHESDFALFILAFCIWGSPIAWYATVGIAVTLRYGRSPAEGQRPGLAKDDV